MSLSTPFVPTRWTVKPRNAEVEKVLRQELGLSNVAAALLAQRGVATAEEAQTFLRCSLDDLHDARLLPDYAIARDAILAARESKDLIYVHGDYDVDGVTSAAIFDRFLKRIGCRVQTHVPHRMREGYGIHESAVDAAIAEGARLFLTCDCGSGALSQIAKAREAGMTVIVTDHHTFGDEWPTAHAFINPHRPDSQYGFHELSGAGVVFKLCAALTQELGFNVQHYYRAYVDLAALGTIADVMPLLGENRIIAKHGLEQLSKTQKLGLQALMAKAEVDTSKPLASYHVGFVLGPRLNAAGRVDDAAKALQLLIETEPGPAADLADLIEQSNTERKAEQRRIVDEAIALVENSSMKDDYVLVVANEGWHTGVVGIVASRLVETYNRPAFVMNIDPGSGMIRGSARSIPNFHLADAIRAMPELMTGGGHAMAAGGSMKIEDLEAVRRRMDGLAREVLSPEDLLPSRTADLEVCPDDMTLRVAEDIQRLEPFGVANAEPVFIARRMTVIEKLPCKNPIHARVIVRQAPGPAVKGIAFNMGERFESISAGCHIDVVYKAEINTWRGSSSFELKIDDVIPCQEVPALLATEG